MALTSPLSMDSARFVHKRTVRGAVPAIGDAPEIRS
jgi:hypothetical protein